MSCHVRAQPKVFGDSSQLSVWPLAISSYVLKECCILQRGITFPTTSIPIASGGHLGESGSLLVVSLCIPHSHQQSLERFYAGRGIIDKDEEDYRSQHTSLGNMVPLLTCTDSDTTPSTVSFWFLSVRNALIQSRVFPRMP